jgi:hypothetical protein
MKLTKQQLKQIIKEELHKILVEDLPSDGGWRVLSSDAPPDLRAFLQASSEERAADELQQADIERQRHTIAPADPKSDEELWADARLADPAKEGKSVMDKLIDNFIEAYGLE